MARLSWEKFALLNHRPTGTQLDISPYRVAIGFAERTNNSVLGPPLPSASQLQTLPQPSMVKASHEYGTTLWRRKSVIHPTQLQKSNLSNLAEVQSPCYETLQKNSKSDKDRTPTKK
jgi:hypothetical protein